MGGLMRRAAVAAGATVVLLGPAVGVASTAGATAGTHLATGRSVLSGGGWGKAKEVAAALNTGGSAIIDEVSCTSTGNCSAGGYYTDSSGDFQAFVVSETNGTWGPATEVAAALDAGGYATIGPVSCASAGNCSAGGSYQDSSGHFQAFIVNETNGTWGPATEVAAALNTGGDAVVDAVSCASAGNCSAGGYYTDSSSDRQAFVIDETNGTWGSATEVAAALNTDGGAVIDSVSCPSAANCGGGGYYTGSPHQLQAFVINETSGTWGTAEEVPGIATLNTGHVAQLNSVSCASAGNCSAGGTYSGTFPTDAFVVNETNGTWGKAKKVSGLTATSAEIYSVSCASAGNCSADGDYGTDIATGVQAIVVNETNGTWGKAKELATSLNTGGDAKAWALSCTSAGYCSAGGSYLDSSGHSQAFVISKP